MGNATMFQSILYFLCCAPLTKKLNKQVYSLQKQMFCGIFMAVICDMAKGRLADCRYLFPWNWKSATLAIWLSEAGVSTGSNQENVERTLLL